MHACNPSAWEAETGWSLQVQDKPGPQSKPLSPKKKTINISIYIAVDTNTVSFLDLGAGNDVAALQFIKIVDSLKFGNVTSGKVLS